jgi:catechol 2,3-dioxygenase-like lactoylglutathione lyase family enzyme
MRLFRVILPVGNIDVAATFYQALLGGQPGERVTAGRHYFECEGTLLACWDAVSDGDPQFPGPNPGVVYLSTPEPLDSVRERVLQSGAVPDPERGSVAVRPWGERSFYFCDPWGNRLCVVATGSEYRGGSFTFP